MENENSPCGQVRIKKSNNHAVLHYSIAVNFRGKNLGSKMLKMAVYKTCHEWKGIPILAFTVPENIASNRSSTSSGIALPIFTESGDGNEIKLAPVCN